MSGLYIHIPFCKQACHYCDFHFSTSIGKKEAMISAIRKELELRKEEFSAEVVETLYFGGGTPSILTSEEINAIIASVYENYQVIKNPEITLEANPDDLSNAKINELAHSSINRLSIGIQSFFNEDLKFMNRAHSSEEALASLALATRQFTNISVDLIYGIPNMSNKRWEENIDKALSFHIPHISCYALTVEPKTALANFIKKGTIKPLSDKVAQDQYTILLEKMENAGFKNYETSNFGKPGYFSKNNTSYWLGKKYMGIGPSAHSFNGLQRSWNVKNNAKYITAIENNELPMEVEVLSIADRYNEYIMTGLRTIWGVSLLKIKEDFGLDYYNYLLKQASKYIDKQLLYINDNVLLTTKKGKFLIDGIAAELFMVNLV